MTFQESPQEGQERRGAASGGGSRARYYPEVAPALLAGGWSPLPLPEGRKADPPKGWTGHLKDADGLPTDVLSPMASGADVAEWIADPGNARANTAARLPLEVVGIDVDHYGQKRGADTWAALVEGHGPPPLTWAVSSRPGTISGIRVFLLPEGADQAALGNGLTDIEILRHGHRYLVAPGSVHPEGGVYRCWDESTGEEVDTLPPVASLPVLPMAWFRAFTKAEKVAQDAAAKHRALTPGKPCQAVLAALSQALGDLGSGRSRHDETTAAVARILRLGDQGHQGVDRALGTLRAEFTEAVATRREGSKVGPRSTSAALREYADLVTSGIALVTAKPTRDEDRGCCLGTSSGLFDTEDDDAPEPWGQPEPFTDGSTVPYPVDALPEGMAAAVTEVAEAVMVDPAIPAMAFLGASSGAFGTDTEVIITPTWRTKCNVYLVTVADTAAGKTPGSAPAWDPLRTIEDFIKDEATKAKREAAVTLPIFKAELKALQKDNPTALRDMLVLQAKISDAEATMRRDARLIVDDVTPERMGELMHDNGGRLVAVNDEGSLLRHLLGMYSSSPNLDPFLKGWDGNMLTVDRKGSGDKPGSELVVPDPRLTLIAAVQPVTIRQIGEPRHRHLIERGVLGRVLPSWPQDTIGQRVFGGRSHKAYRKVDPWNAEVLRLGRAGKHSLPFTDAAREVFLAWHDEVERALPAGGLYADVRSFSKVRESTARIAGIMARHDGAVQVEAEHVRRAIRIGDYHLAHALALVESWKGAPTEVARNLVTRLPRLSGKAPEGVEGPRIAKDGSMRFSVREATRAAKAKVDVVTDALYLLAEHGYVRPESRLVGFGEVGLTVGKRSAVVLLNPAALEGLDG